MYELRFYDRCEHAHFTLSTYDTKEEAEEKRLFVLSKFKKEHRKDAEKCIKVDEYVPDAEHGLSGKELLICLNKAHRFNLPVMDEKDTLFKGVE